MFGAEFGVVQGGGRGAEVDQNVELVDHRRQIAAEGYAQLADAGQLTGVGADQGAFGALDGGAQLGVVIGADGFDQGFTHAARSAADGDFDGHEFSSGGGSWEVQLSSPSSNRWPSLPRLVSR